MHRLSTFPFVLLPFLLAPLGAQPGGSAGRGGTEVTPLEHSYDIGELIAPMKVAFPQDDAGESGVFLPRVPALAESFRSNREAPRNVVFGFPGPALDQNRLLSLVTDPRVASRDGLLIWRDSLRYRGTRARQDRLRDLLQTLRHALHPRIRVEVSVLAGAPLPERADLDGKAVDALLAGATRRSVHHALVRGDVGERIRSGTQATFILDWNPEVAEKSAIYDPKVKRVELGLRLGLFASVLADGRVEILAGLQQSVQRERAKVTSLVGRGQGVLHHPRIASRLLVSRGVIADGGALVIGGVAGMHGLCVIRCHVEPRDPNALSGRFQAIPLGDILEPIPTLPGIAPPLLPGQERLEEEVEAVDLTSSLQAALGTDEARSSDWLILGNHLLVLGEAGQDTSTRAVSKRLHGLIRKRCALRHTVSLELRSGIVAGETVASYLAGKTKLDEFAAKVPSLGIVAALPGHPFQHIEGLESTFIRDLDVEIAAKATAANPHVVPSFSGASVTGTLRRGLNGGLSLDGAFYHAQVGTSRIDAAEPVARDIDAVSRDFVQQPIRSVAVKRGRWQLLSLQENPAGTGSVVLLMRVAK